MSASPPPSPAAGGWPVAPGGPFAAVAPPPADTAANPLPLPFWIVDAFTDQPFSGNPAAVVLLPAGGVFPEDIWMAKVTAEFALSNTAFVSRRGATAAEGFALRWFTPGGAEVSLCGHATLAAAHALWAAGIADESSGALLRFHTRGGLVSCIAQTNAPPGAAAIAMDFPAAPAVEASPGAPAAVLPALGPGAPLPIWVGRSEALNDCVIVLEAPEAVRDLAPNLPGLAALGGRGVIVTAAARGAAWAGGADYVCRWFAPAVGIPEDAVTGSAHCCLGPFWADRLRKGDLLALQVSPRAGRVAVRVDPPSGRVALLGDAVTVFRGEILAQPGAMMTS